MTNKSIGLSQELHDYMCTVGVREHPVLQALRQQTQKMPERKMQISPEQGSFLQSMVRLINAKSILEIGVYTGYSSLAMALAMPDDGRIIALDRNREWTKLAQKYWQQAGVDHKIELIIGQAQNTLMTIHHEFDLVYVDADKRSYDFYFEHALPYLKKGGVMLFDNTLLNGKIIDPLNTEKVVLAMRDFNEKLFQDVRVHMTMIPLGDGLTFVQKI
ncbi:MAG: class I SAM-dependent methyltransferase [Alphaproteobacteria bacterium]|nr:class I SAM-dependent methyltransferase [Alphaproteobacteria bacterium]